MELRDDDVLTVLHTLEYDRMVDCGPGLGEDDEDVFRETKLPVPEHHAATSLPCGVCPVRTPRPLELLLSSPTRFCQTPSTFPSGIVCQVCTPCCFLSSPAGTSVVARPDVK